MFTEKTYNFCTFWLTLFLVLFLIIITKNTIFTIFAVSFLVLITIISACVDSSESRDIINLTPYTIRQDINSPKILIIETQ